MNTFDTTYGKITLYQNECYIGAIFKQNNYWDEDSMLQLKQYIDPTRNILEIGGHCGTSSIVYSTFLNDTAKIHVYEPQLNMYNLLVHNITQNDLQHKIIPYNSGVFCYNGIGRMNNTDLDGDDSGCIVSKRYNDENDKVCNFGGIGLGHDGETINLTTIDTMELNDIGFIHCDAQGSENFIFSKAINTITKYRPVIYYENNELFAKKLYNSVCDAYPDYAENSKFDIKKYCMETLNYSSFIDEFNGGLDTILIP